MDISTKQLTKNVIFGSTRNSTVGSDTAEFLSEVFSDITEQPISKIKTVNITPNYDSYKVDVADKSFLIKLSYENPSAILSKEALCLKDINQPVVPKLIDKSDYLDVAYLITSYENAPNLTQIKHELDLDQLFFRLDQVHSTAASNLPSFAEVFTNIAEDELKQIYDDNTPRQILRTSEHFFFKSLGQQIIKQAKPILHISEGDSFCHGHLDGRHILTNGVDYKFCNFTQSFRGKSLIDKINLAYDLEIEAPDWAEFTGLGESDIELIELVGLYRISLLIKEYIQQKYIFNFSDPRDMFFMSLSFLNNSPVYSKFLPEEYITKFFDLLKKTLGKY